VSCQWFVSTVHIHTKPRLGINETRIPLLQTDQSTYHGCHCIKHSTASSLATHCYINHLNTTTQVSLLTTIYS